MQRAFAFQAFTGLGFAVILTLFFHSVCDLGVITWSAQATYLLFGQLQEIPDNFFYSKYDFFATNLDQSLILK